MTRGTIPTTGWLGRAWRRLRPTGRRQVDAAIGKVYRTHEPSGAYFIEVALDSYESLFNDWDPAPFKRRDMDPDLRDYLQDCGRDIPLRHPVHLLFSLPAESHDPQAERRARQGVQRYFVFEVNALRARLSRLWHEVLVYLALAVVLLVVTAVLAPLAEAGLGWQILYQGLTIGAWVFAWESVSTFAFTRTRLTRALRRWKRLADAEITFRRVADSSETQP